MDSLLAGAVAGTLVLITFIAVVLAAIGTAVALQLHTAGLL